MPKRLEHDAKTLNNLLRYEPLTGRLYWLPRSRALFTSDRLWKTWNTNFAGKPALIYIQHSGYFAGQVLQTMYMAHRIIWCMMTGKWPNKIDHINGDPSDNRWINLREATLTENQQNRRIGKNNRSGVMGVRWNKKSQKWRATITANKEQIHLGSFSSFESACEMRRIAERNYLFHPNHGRPAP